MVVLPWFITELIEGNGYEGRQTSKGELFVNIYIYIFIIPLLRHFTIFGQEKAQNMKDMRMVHLLLFHIP